MKYSAVIAAFVTNSAGSQVEVDKVFHQDKMSALLNVVQAIETKDDSKIFDVIDNRKDQLQLLMNAHPDQATEVLSELRNLLAITANVEQGNMDGALAEIEVRSAELAE